MICVSGGVLSTITERVAEAVYEELSVAVPEIVALPSLMLVVSQRADAVADKAGREGEIEIGSGWPAALRLMLVTATLSVAVTDIVMVW